MASDVGCNVALLLRVRVALYVLVFGSYCLMLMLPITPYCWKWYGFRHRLQRCVITLRTRHVAVLVFGSYRLMLLLPITPYYSKWYGFRRRLQRCVITSRTRHVVVLVFGSYCLMLMLPINPIAGSDMVSDRGFNVAVLLRVRVTL